MLSQAIPLIAQGGTVVGVSWVLFQFVKWVIEFSCKRLDARADKLVKLQDEIDRKMGDWRQSLERDFRTLKLKVGVYEQATNMLVGELQRKDPSNATLAMVDRILRPYRDVETPAPGETDPDGDLLEKLP